MPLWTTAVRLADRAALAMPPCEYLQCPDNSLHHKHTAPHLRPGASCSLVTRRQVPLCAPTGERWVENIVEHVKQLRKCCSNKAKCRVTNKVAFFFQKCVTWAFILLWSNDNNVIVCRQKKRCLGVKPE